ncbi:MAG: ABC transporter ATP-binding protein, partial [Nitrospinota bacterium]
MNVVETENIRHSYPARRNGTARQALNGIDLSVDQGEIFGFLGPNGSGKTTLFKILSTLISPSSGSGKIFGFDITSQVNDVRRHIGVVFQRPSLDKMLTVGENLLHQGHLYGLRGSDLRAVTSTLLDKFGLTDRRDEPVQHLSGGLMRRVELAKGLMHNPQLLILDEPSTGLDPGARRALWKTLGLLRENDSVTILLTSHLSEEIDQCDRLAVMDRGNIVVTGSPGELKREIGGDIVTIVSPSPDELIEKIRNKFSGEPMMVNGEIRLEIEHGHEFIPKLVESFP